VIKVPYEFREELVEKIDSVVFEGDESWEPPSAELRSFLLDFLASNVKHKEIRTGTRITGGTKGIFLHQDYEKRYFALPRVDCSRKLLMQSPEAVPKFRKSVALSTKVETAIDEGLAQDLRKQVLQSAFRAVDEDGNGCLSKSEVSRLLRRIMYALTHEDIDTIMKEADTNEDGKLDYDEFANWLNKNATGKVAIRLQKSVYRESDILRALFRAFDIDGNGLISRKELHVVFAKSCPHFSKKQVDVILDIMDVNHDGHVDYDEFVDFLWGQHESETG